MQETQQKNCPDDLRAGLTARMQRALAAWGLQIGEASGE